MPPSNNQTTEEQLALLKEKHTQAIDAINQMAKGGHVVPSQYKEGEQVWLEATNLRLHHQKTKLAPKQYGPFKIIKVLRAVWMYDILSSNHHRFFWHGTLSCLRNPD